MAYDLIFLVRCPRCRGELKIEGNPPRELACPSCEAKVPVVSGIPRVVADSYAASFGRQWNRYDVARPIEDEATFWVKTGISPSELAGCLVLDAGCGGGRYTRLVAGHGARVVGVDRSAAVEKAAELCANLANVLIVQSDLLDLPLAERAFDVVFSVGVLHHTPDPRRAFAQIARRVKPGGRLAVWLYRRNTTPQEWLNAGLRSVTTRVSPHVLERLCACLGALGAIPVLKQTLNKLVNFSNHPDWTLRVCDNFDWYAPRYQSHHTLEELKRWFTEEGFTDLIELPPAKQGAIYDWAYHRNLIIGSGVNVSGRRPLSMKPDELSSGALSTGSRAWCETQSSEERPCTPPS
jgi:SAM-dependent methyltransferase